MLSVTIGVDWISPLSIMFIIHVLFQIHVYLLIHQLTLTLRVLIAIVWLWSLSGILMCNSCQFFDYTWYCLWALEFTFFFLLPVMKLFPVLFLLIYFNPVHIVPGGLGYVKSFPFLEFFGLLSTIYFSAVHWSLTTKRTSRLLNVLLVRLLFSKLWLARLP